MIVEVGQYGITNIFSNGEEPAQRIIITAEILSHTIPTYYNVVLHPHSYNKSPAIEINGKLLFFSNEEQAMAFMVLLNHIVTYGDGEKDIEALTAAMHTLLY